MRTFRLSDSKFTSGLKKRMTKHEIIRCERCEAPFECKANSFTKCQCSTVQLTLNEVQYVSELYEGCLCASCLLVIQQEYRVSMGLV
jgi:hypothetical protein